MRTIDDITAFATDPKHIPAIQMVDLRFTDLWGVWHHITIPVAELGEKLMQEGVPFDGSSLGFKSVHASDMVLVPDLSTALIDPFCAHGTLAMICNVAEANTLEAFANCPRTVAQKAEKLLQQLGIAERSVWGPEFEFYIFDKIVYRNDINIAYYRIDSDEADWNTGAEQGRNLGGKIPRKGGYHAMAPFDSLYTVRTEMAQRIKQAGIPVRYHHHEVGGPGQSEIEIKMLPLVKAADAVMQIKYITRMVAREAEKTVTYMPKPLYNEAGSGMHFHQYLERDGKSLFYEKDTYAYLSETALNYTGGILKHGKSLLGLTNPSTNSFKRLIPGFEAPVSLCYGLANRSAAIRIPKYVNSPIDQRIEFRPPDGTSNPYLAMAAQLMAGIEGILEHIDPVKEGFGPVDKNLFDMPESERERIGRMPTSLKEALNALKEDHAYLMRGEVFNEELIRLWYDTKMRRDYEEVRNRPHPYEMSLYFDM